MAGSSAFRAATLRKFQIEMDSQDNLDWVLVLWDLRKFYDTIRIAALVRQGVRLKFPPAIIGMAVATYQSPRVLRTREGACSEWVVPFDSVLAGCSMANDMARLSVYDMCEELSQASVRAQLSQYVDDFTQYASHSSAKWLSAAVSKDAVSFVKAVQDNHFDLSTKSLVISNSEEVAEAVRTAVVQANAPMQVVTIAKDLGIDLTSNTRRRIPQARERIRKAARRHDRIIKLHAKRPQVRVWRGAALPQAQYGLISSGLAPSTRLRLRGQLATHAGWRPGMCSTSLLELELPGRDPSLHIPMRHIQEYIELWLTMDLALRSRVQTHWQSIRESIFDAAGKVSWNKIKFPVASVIGTLLERNWNPKTSAHWIDPAGVSWVLSDEPADLRLFNEHVYKSFRLQAWQALEGGYLASGMCSDMDVSVARKLLKNYLKEDDHLAANILRRVVTAGVWTSSRQADAGILEEPECPLCGGPADTWSHRCWECAAPNALPAPEIRETNHLQPEARKALDEHKHPLWLRGIIPLAWYQLPAAPQQATIEVTGVFLELKNSLTLDASQWTLYLDESGGPHAAEPLLRRAGWGLAAFHKGSSQLLGGIAGTVEGVSQTSNRAALLALEFALDRFRGHVEIVPDSKYVVDGVNLRKRHLFPSGANSDIWHGIGQKLRDNQQTLVVRKTTSHLEQKRKDFYTMEHLDERDFLGNSAADAYADRAATIAGSGMASAELGLSFLRGRCTKLLKRFVEIQRAISLKLGTAKSGMIRVKPPPRIPLLLKLLAETDHTLDFDRSVTSYSQVPAVIKCRCCCQSVTKPNLSKWLKSGRCPAASQQVVFGAAGGTKVWANSSPSIVVAGFHSSHLLMYRSGVWWCSRCGAFSQATGARLTARLLRQRCSGHPTASGSYQLRRLAKGQTPRPHVQWQHDADTVPPAALVPARRLRRKTAPALTFVQSTDEHAEHHELDGASLDARDDLFDEDPFGHLGDEC